MTARRCLCACHYVLGEPHRADGVDVRDPLFAVSACAECQPHHSSALSDRAEPHHTPLTDNGESNPYLPPQQYSGEDGG